MKGEVAEEVLSKVLDSLPFEFSYVDEDDRVRLFNKNGDRIFPRPPGVIGRRVQDCHPSKSVDKVQQILDEMKAGKRDSAEFWIDLNDRKIHIRYFAVRENGEYMGCLEVSQDITDLQKIRGEKRLLT
jgi:PAS domain S-box-containing protein